MSQPEGEERDTLIRVVQQRTPLLLAEATRVLGGSPETAKELVQEAIAAVLARPPRGPGQRSEATSAALLFSVFRNKLVDEVRRQRHSPELRDPDGLDSAQGVQLMSITATIFHRRTPLADLVAEEDRAALWRAVEALPELERQIVLRKHVHGESLRSTARSLSIPLSTVADAHERGLARLKRSLSKTAPSPTSSDRDSPPDDSPSTSTPKADDTTAVLVDRPGFSPDESTTPSTLDVNTKRPLEREDAA